MKKQRKIRKPKWMSVKWLKANYATVIGYVWGYISILIAIVFLLVLCFDTDFEAATKSDWDYMYEQLEILEKEGSEAFANMEDIKLTLENRTLTFESEQCKLILEMNDENMFVETSKVDKAYLGFEIFGVGIAAIWLSCAVGGGTFAVGLLLFAGIEWGCEKINLLLKRNRES